MKNFWTTLCAAAMLGASLFSAQAQEGKTITMGTMSWEDILPVTGVTKIALENAGYTVNVVPFSEWGIAYTALARGDIQILASQIDYVAQDYWDRNKDRLEKLSPVSHGLYQALAVPSYVSINSMEELNDHADKFGGRIVGIEPGSGLMRETVEAIEAYGIDLQLIEGSTAAMTAALKSAVDREEWIVATLWTPTWMAKQFDMKFLADPKGIYSAAQGYYWIAKAGFAAENPHAREVIAGVYLPLEANLEINSAVNDGMTMDEAVADWAERNADLMQRWGNIKSQ